MPRYHLVAARDGDLVDEVAEWADQDAAEAWAIKRLVEEFRLEDFEFETFEDLGAETDGCSLDELPSAQLIPRVIELLQAISSFAAESRDRPHLVTTAHERLILQRVLALANSSTAQGRRAKENAPDPPRGGPGAGGAREGGPRDLV